ncbi:hypothetical protein LCGC14_0366530, partial [marine sediment metagenome]
MPFIHPAIFWTGLAAVAVPILIHLLNRRRFRLRDWAAMQFIRQALRRHRRRLQIEQLILLALRCLIIALLAAALARFTGCGSLALLPSAEVGRTTIFVLDDSVSMGQKLGPTTAFDLATADLAEQLDLLPDGETVAIRRTSDRDDSPLFAMNFVTDRTSLVTKLQTLQPSDGRADLAAALGWGAKLSAWVRARLGARSLRDRDVPDTAVILFTSGSENVPKAVPLTHRNMLTNIADGWDCFSISPADSMLGLLPPFHSFGLTVSILLPMCLGLRAVYHPNPTDGAAGGEMIHAYKATILAGTPTFLSGIVRASGADKLGSLRLVISGAEKCPDRVYRALARRCPQTTVLEGYGVTECSPIVAVNHEDSPRAGTIGQVMGSLEYALVDPQTNRRVAPGDRGVLLVRGPSVFGGYLNYDGPSPFVEFDGRQWYRTGDLVTEDDGG